MPSANTLKIDEVTNAHGKYCGSFLAPSLQRSREAISIACLSVREYNAYLKRQCMVNLVSGTNALLLWCVC